MAEIRQRINCTYCGNKNTVSIIIKQSKRSRSVKVTKCSDCRIQSGIKATLNNT